MNYAVIKKNDIANGPGIRTSVFVSGCRHKCKGCFNREAWDFNYGMPFAEKTEEEILISLIPDYVDGLSFLGGEPFEKENAAELLELAKKFKLRFPDKSLWCYTGFLFEELASGNIGEACVELLKITDVLVDGKFVESLKSEALIFRGSSNQRIIDVKKSFEENRVVLLDGKWERKIGSGDIYE